MLYILENEYTKKLYTQLVTHISDLQLVQIDKLEHIHSEAILIVDALDLYQLTNCGKDFPNLIQLGTQEDLEKSNHRTILKYQSYKNILILINESNFPVALLTSAECSKFDPNFIGTVAGTLESDYIISLNQSHSKGFSLYDCLMDSSPSFEKHQIYEILNNFQDYMNPPIEEILKIIHQLRQKGAILVVSSPLKGPLDYAILKMANKLVWPNEKAKESMPFDVKSINPNIQMVTLNKDGGL